MQDYSESEVGGSEIYGLQPGCNLGWKLIYRRKKESNCTRLPLSIYTRYH